MKYYKDELIKVWRRSFYDVKEPSDNTIPDIIDDEIEPYDVDFITDFCFQEDVSKVEIYETDTDKLIYQEDCI